MAARARAREGVNGGHAGRPCWAHRGTCSSPSRYPLAPPTSSSQPPPNCHSPTRNQATKALITDTGSQEYAIATRAFGRIERLVAELGLGPETTAMACQAAEILLMMRQVRARWCTWRVRGCLHAGAWHGGTF